MKSEERNNQIKAMADAMGVSLYQQFSEKEAAKFLNISTEVLVDVRTKGLIAYLQVSPSEINYFATHLIEYLIESTVPRQSAIKTSSSNHTTDRILRVREVVELTGISRTTIWRLELDGRFPSRVNLGVGSVGWRESDIQDWILNRE